MVTMDAPKLFGTIDIFDIMSNLQDIIGQLNVLSADASQECKDFMVSLVTKLTDQSFYISYLEGRLNMSPEELEQLKQQFKTRI
jgi:hypothetical protein